MANSFVQQIAAKVSELGLVWPTVFLLEAHKPFAFIGSQLLLIAQPSLQVLGFGHEVNQWLHLLDDEQAIEDLIQTLERPKA